MMTKKDIEKYLNLDKLTSKQKEAVKKDAPILVSASAGSGKTTVLATRVIYNILNKQISPNRMLVVTFTKAAAQEMKSRINKVYDNVLIESGDDSLIKKKSEIELMKVMTIDSFCSSLLKEYFEEADISFDFHISDENMISKLKLDVIDEVFENEYKDNKENFKKISDYFSLKSDEKLKDVLIDLYNHIQKQPFKEKWIESLMYDYENISGINNSVWAKDIKNFAKQEIDILVEVFKENFYLIDKDPVLKECFLPTVNEYIYNLKTLSKKISRVNYLNAGKAIREFQILTFARYNKDKNPFDRELAEKFKKRTVEQLKKAIKRLGIDYFISEKEFKKEMENQKKIITDLLNLNEKVTKLLIKNKLEQNTLDFSDLISLTIKLLSKNSKCEKTNLGKEISKQFDEILIDEYQDVNQSQDILFSLLSKNEKNLFLVGDVKQSIYRFRDADVDVFIKRRDKLLKQDKQNIINLVDNFRSRPQVTETVNTIFENLLSKNFGGLDYDECQKLKASGSFEGEDNFKTELHLLNQDKKGDDAIIEEAEHIAYTIKTMINNKFKIDDNGKLRPCVPSDFAILLRSTQKSAQIIEEKLTLSGISVKQEGLTGYLKSREVSLVVSLLKIIDNPLLDLAMLSVIMSPLFNFTEDDILKIRLVNQSVPLYKCILLSKDKKCRKFTKTLYYLREISPTIKVSELIQEIYDKTYYYAICCAMPQGEQKVANLRLLLSYAKDYEERSRDGLSGFLRMIDKTKSINKDFEAANISSDEKESVKMMTIHKSKGLEFPIVILARTGIRFNEKDLNSPILFTKKYKLAMKESNSENLTRFTTLPFIASFENEKRMMKAEELRILYVALTRAKDKLIIINKNSANGIMKTPKEKAISIGDFILPIFKSNKNNTVIFKEGAKKIKETMKKDKLVKLNDDEIKYLDSKFEYKYNNEQLTKIPFKLSVSEIVKSNTNTIELKTPKFDNKLTPAERGTAAHEFLQYADFDRASDNIEKEIERLVKLEFISKKQAKALNKEKLKKFFRSNFYKRISNSNKIEREKSFLYELPTEELYEGVKGGKILIQGIADCVIEEKGNLIIIDYKTDNKTENELIKTYKVQLNLYKKAIQDMESKPVKECYLYSLHHNKEIKVI